MSNSDPTGIIKQRNWEISISMILNMHPLYGSTTEIKMNILQESYEVLEMQPDTGYIYQETTKPFRSCYKL